MDLNYCIIPLISLMYRILINQETAQMGTLSSDAVVSTLRRGLAGRETLQGVFL